MFERQLEHQSRRSNAKVMLCGSQMLGCSLELQSSLYPLSLAFKSSVSCCTYNISCSFAVILRLKSMSFIVSCSSLIIYQGGDMEQDAESEDINKLLFSSIVGSN
ncbi:hypothetical protein Nepgr_012409 [Nepenthes gracilis]|uniref:Uncharacterized protein n=1 Tax=Nepenthes gracilis TaxID=150966 RepID=A0AAD3SFY2_NEPGR|nr:hypothetical protein Nepgr_012409 [Nepenthes gracilis]